MKKLKRYNKIGLYNKLHNFTSQNTKYNTDPNKSRLNTILKLTRHN